MDQVVTWSVAAFNALPDAAARTELLACCAADRFAEAVTAGRPYPDRGAVLAAADVALRELTWPDVAQALAAHPRIGERAAGAGREAAWSRQEQSGVERADAQTRAELARANAQYEARFGHLFLVFASGRDDAGLLAAARERLTHDEPTERRVVHGELRRIALLRLERLFDEHG